MNPNLKYLLVAGVCLALAPAMMAQDAASASAQTEQKDTTAPNSPGGNSTIDAPAAAEQSMTPPPAIYVPKSTLDMFKLNAKYGRLQAWDYDATWFPGFGDRVTGEAGGLREAMLKYNIGFTGMEISAFDYNLLNPPMYGANGPDASGHYHPATKGTAQQYIGQRPTGYNNTYLVLTKNFGDNTQLELCSEHTWTSFLPVAETDTVKFCAIQINQYLLNRRLKIMAGYFNNADQFWGLYVAGNMGGSLLGALAIIPFEIGEAPIYNIRPALTVRANLTENVYSSTQIQSSTNPTYGSANYHDPFYLPFACKGCKAFLTEEIGIKRPAAPGVHQIWARADGFYNFTHYADYRTYTGWDAYHTSFVPPSYRETDNNFGFYAGVDYQLLQTPGGLPSRGLYVGGVVEYAPPQQNLYTQYYEIRAYFQGPSTKRPLDMITSSVNNTEFSKVGINVMQNLEFIGSFPPPYYQFVVAGPANSSTGQTNYTASYVAHASRGLWLNAGIDYVSHPTYTPKTPNAFVFQAGWCIFW